MNPDFADLLRAFIDAEVRFLVVGAQESVVKVQKATMRALRALGRPKDLADLEALGGDT